MNTNAYGYLYDPIGNRIWAVANALNQYSQIADGITNDLYYDFDGNLTNDAGFTYSWDGENRMVGATTTNMTASYAYDYMSRRSQKVVNDITNMFLYDGWNLIEEISSTGTAWA